MFDDSHLFDAPPKETREVGSYERLARIEQKMNKVISLLEKIAKGSSGNNHYENNNLDLESFYNFLYNKNIQEK